MKEKEEKGEEYERKEEKGEEDERKEEGEKKRMRERELWGFTTMEYGNKK
jgi:hypothetical protein